MSKDMSELLEEFMNQRNVGPCLEGERGVRTLNTIVQALEYRSLEEFFYDNSGAIEAVFNWIGTQNAPEWKEMIQEKLK